MMLVSTLLPKGCRKKTRSCREYIQDVRVWLTTVSADRQAAFGAERISRCDSRRIPRSGTRRAARMSESHAGTFRYHDLGCGCQARVRYGVPDPVIELVLIRKQGTWESVIYDYRQACIVILYNNFKRFSSGKISSRFNIISQWKANAAAIFHF